MLQVQNLSKSFGDRQLFKQINFHINQGERIGLVGRNGHGKTTLIKILQGQEGYDEGEITFPKNYSIGSLSQYLKISMPTVREEAALGLKEEEKDDLYKVERILMGLGFKKEDFSRSPLDFSGGYQIRMHLAKALVSNPHLLLLDEPTNYLDILALRWLEGFLKSWPGELIIITHDRHFLDEVCTHVMGLHRGKIKKISGSTLDYYTYIQEEELLYEKTLVNEQNKIKKIEEFIEKFRAKATKAKQVQSRVKSLNRREKKEKLPMIEKLDFQFAYAPCPAKILFQLSEGSFHYEGQVPLYKDLSLVIEAGDRIGIIGKNGRGKSTLLRALNEDLKLTTGFIKSHPQLSKGYFGQTHVDRLHPEATIEEEVAAENPQLGISQVRSICGLMLFSGDEAKKKIRLLSGGERARVLMAKILCHPSNLLLLDEPTNHLDMESVEALTDAIEEFKGAVVFVSHHEELLRRVANKLVVFTGDGASFFHGTYDDFLEKVGWEEEKVEGSEGEESRGESDQKSKEKNPLSKQKKFEINQMKVKELSPFKKEAQKIEERITEIEKASKLTEEKLIAASEKNLSKEIIQYNADLKTFQQEEEELFLRLEEVHEKIQQIENHYKEL